MIDIHTTPCHISCRTDSDPVTTHRVALIDKLKPVAEVEVLFVASDIAKRSQTDSLLNHLLDQPDLPAIIESLDATLLTRLIRHIGLEDSGPIILHATSDQLENVFDEDLWHSSMPGRVEKFDADRFGMWLRVMEENSPSFAERKILAMDEDLLALGICRLVQVINCSATDFCLGDGLENDYEGFPEHLASEPLSQLLAGYHLISKDDRSWDAILGLLTELNETDGDRLDRLLDRCSRIIEEVVDNNSGLLTRLSGVRMLEEDVAAEREKRKEKMGFVTPLSAAFFLDQSRRSSLKRILSEKTMPHAVRLYIKATETKNDVAEKLQQPEAETAGTAEKGISPFIEILRKADLLPDPKQHQLSYDGADFSNTLLPLTRAMSLARESDPDLYASRITELSFLSNTLIAGCRFRGRSFSPKEAAEAALSVCNLGSDYLLRPAAERKKDRLANRGISDLLKTDHLVRLFQVGWKILYEHAVLTTAKTVLAFMEGLSEEVLDPDEKRETAGMLRLLRAGILSGRPWKIHEEMDYLQIFLDGDTIDTLKGLIQEYPTFSESVRKAGGLNLSPHIGSLKHIRTLRHFLKDSIR